MFKFLLKSAVAFWAGVAVVLLLLTVIGCDHGSNIPIEGENCSAVCDGDDVCGVVGVEECFPTCEICLSRDLYIRNLSNVFNTGFDRGVDSVVCEVGNEQEDECNEDSPPGHLRKECRGHDND